MSRYSVSVDIGGTFTDFVLLDNDEKRVTTTKVLSTPGRSDEAIFEGFANLRESTGLDLTECDVFMHATTVITAAIPRTAT